MPGHLGTDFYRMVLERARYLLTALHNEVIQQENSNTIVTDFASQGEIPLKRQVVESKVYNMAKAVQISKNKDVPVVNNPDIHQKFMEDQSLDNLPQVDNEEYKGAIKNLEKAGKAIDKSHIREFLSFVRPEPIIGKLFQVIAILKGF